MRPLVSVDIETTGLDPQWHSILEVGIVSDQGNVTFSLPFDKIKYNGVPNWTDEAFAINGWGVRPFPEQIDPIQAVHRLEMLLNDAHLVGKNPSFDEAFLRALFRRHDVKPTWHHRLVDVGALAWGYYQVAGFGMDDLRHPPDVTQVEKMTGIERELIDGYHTALLDAVWAHRVLRSIVPE